MKVVLSAGAENQDSGALMRIFDSLRRSGLTIGACRSAINQMLKDGVTFKERDDEVDIQKASEEELDPRSFDKPRTVFYDEETVAKVYLALTQSGLGSVASVGAITAMQNAGILFRERC
jgi:hypothetical protein